jgi:CRP/FNR family transcriptional regulator, cyclic AMP receptor protein
MEGTLCMPLKNPEMLKKFTLFSLLDENETETLANHLDELNFLAGKIIFKIGDPGGIMYVVESGKVELYLQDKADERVHLGYVNEGELFGELSLLDNEARSASAKAIEDTRLIAIDREDLLILVQSHPPAALDMMSALGHRIRSSNHLVRERVVVKNVNDEMQSELSLGEKLSDMLTAIAGDIRFVYFSLIWFFVWVVWNTHLIPNLEAFDPFPFGLLTMVVSLEAIFLSLFVLISQNRQAARDKIRNDIEYNVNIKAEYEIRQLSHQLEEMQNVLVGHFGMLQRNVNDEREMNHKKSSV